MWTDASGPVLLSVQVAVISTIFVAGAGIFAGRLMARASFKGKTLLETFLMLPLVLPPTVVGFLLIVIFGVNSPAGRLIEQVMGSPVIFTRWAAVIAAGVVSFPLMYQAAKHGFQMVDREIEDASRVDGAGGMQTFLHITLPLAVPSLITGVVLSLQEPLGNSGQV